VELRGYDPIELAKRLEKLVARGRSRKYYRFRAARFYGGIATGDVVGCNLRCAFCWSGRPRDDPTLGEWVDSDEAYNRLCSIALSKGFKKVRLSGGEPTIGREHLVSLLERFEEDGRFLFILETNGLLIGYDPNYAKYLSRFSVLHVRLSVKACSPDLFTRITAAKPDAFNLVLEAVKRLSDSGVSFHVAIVVSFGDRDCWARFIEQLAEHAGPEVVQHLEPEVVKLYPHVVKRLKARGIWPHTYY
jgi:uncharacterized Fe-S cluster-containing radical SAM superfamily protein